MMDPFVSISYFSYYDRTFASGADGTSFKVEPIKRSNSYGATDKYLNGQPYESDDDYDYAIASIVDEVDENILVSMMDYTEID